MTFHVPVTDIITANSTALALASNDIALVLPDIELFATATSAMGIYGYGVDSTNTTVRGTVYGAGTGIALFNDADYNMVTVAEGGFVGGGTNAGISTAGLGNRVDVLGQVTGSWSGIEMQIVDDGYVTVVGSVSAVNAGVKASGDTLHLANSGSITATTYGVYVDKNDAIITNAGTISGQSGVFVYRADATIANSGTIQGMGDTGTGITLFTWAVGYPELHKVVTINNSGVIQGATAIGAYPDNQGVSDVTVTVRNSGAINGNVVFERGNDVYDGALGALNGTLDAGAGHDTVLGGAGNETFIGGAGIDSLDGAGGRNSLDGGDNDDYIFGGDGDDTMLGGGGIDQMYGGAGNDGMVGGEGIDLMLGDAGDDYMLGQAGNDIMDGGTGNDTMQGGDNDDLMKGGAGDDSLLGQAGADEIDAGEGNDTVNGGAGADSMDGGAGIDLLSYQGSAGGVTVNMATGETLGGDAVFDLFSGFEQLEGSGWNDELTGSAAADTIWGGGGNDLVLGAAGNDVLRGGDGNDTLVGGAGRDVLIGGAGADTFRFTSMADLGKAAGARDILRDFQTGVDKIDLSLIDPIAGGADDAFVFSAGQGFTGTGVAELRFVASGNDTMVQLDADGNGTFDAAFLINGNGVPMSADFIL